MLHIVPKIRFTMGLPKFSGIQYENLKGYLKPGDILVSVDRSKLSTLLIPGEWSHAAIWTGTHVMEALPGGVEKNLLYDFCRTADDIGVVSYKDQAYAQVMATEAEKYLGLEYDAKFSMGPEQVYCSELVFLADKERRLKLNLQDFHGIGMDYICPDDVWNAQDCAKVTIGKPRSKNV